LNGTATPGSGTSGMSFATMAALSTSMPTFVSADTGIASLGQSDDRSILLRTMMIFPSEPEASATVIGFNPRIQCRTVADAFGSDDPRSNGSLPSNTHTHKSAFASTLCVREIPSRSRTSPDSRNPAVSISSIGQPSSASVVVTRSRVVPGIGATTHLAYPASALTRLLLPTFGAPAITTRHGSTRCRPNFVQRASSFNSATSPASTFSHDSLNAPPS